MRFTTDVDRRTLQRRLAAHLFRFETMLPFGLFSFDADTYRGAPGKDGLRRYRQPAEAEWRKLIPRDAKGDFDAHRARITGIMERLAKAAHEGICDRGTLIALAGQPEPSRSGDAVSLYRRVVPTIVEQTNNAAYDEADGVARSTAAAK